MSPLQTIDERFAAWSAARAEANLAYEDWCHSRSEDSYVVYRAAEDRADAAERELAAVSRPLIAV